MDRVFLTIVNMSITAAYSIAVVLAVRLLLRRAPKWLSYALWSIVGVRLLCPVSFTSSVSMLGNLISLSAVRGKLEYIPSDIGTQAIPRVDVGISTLNVLINDSLPWSIPAAGTTPLQIAIGIGFWIWLAGILVLLGYSAVSYIRLKNRLNTATLIRDNLFETDAIDSPFVCGFFKPAIYLPFCLVESDRDMVIKHENAHLRRFDHWIKLIACLALAIHWFNPLVWLAFRLMRKDMEMSCDERVLRDLSRNEKANYGETLVRLAMKRPLLAESPLAFGENSIKSRVKNILNYRKPAFWVVLMVVPVLIIVGIGLLANPSEHGLPYATYIGQRDFFGSRVYSTIDYQSTDKERAIVAPVLATAEKVFTYVGPKASADQNVGALSRYYHYTDERPFSSSKLDLRLITAKVKQNSGYLWVVYSEMQYDQDGENVSGSSNILSYWEIEKTNDQWMVVEITEHP